MSKEKNVSEEELPAADKQLAKSNEEVFPGTGNGVPSGENNYIPEPTIINEQQQSKDMEVHHPHHITHKKKWGEYLLEFFMLFLAVFLGFVAENIRENSVERHQEKEYMQSLTEDVRHDIQTINTGIEKTLLQIRGKDSLVQLIGDGVQTPQQVNLLYQMHWNYVGYITEIPFSKRTINQLLNAGGLRLVSNKKVSDAIAFYAAKVDYQEKTRQPQYIDLNYRALFASGKLIDARYIRALPDKRYERAPYENPVLRNTNTDQLKDFSFALEMDKDNCILFVQYLEEVKELAVRLLSLLEKEYNL